MVENDHLKVKDGHLTLLVCLPHSPQSSLKFGWRNIIYVSLFGKLYILNLFKNEMEKTYENKGKQCLLWAQVSKFTFC